MFKVIYREKFKPGLLHGIPPVQHKHTSASQNLLSEKQVKNRKQNRDYIRKPTRKKAEQLLCHEENTECPVN